MTITVKQEIGREKNPYQMSNVTPMAGMNNFESYHAFEENVKSYPAPGIPDTPPGEFVEAELVWQYLPPWNRCKDGLKWSNIRNDELQWFKNVKRYDTRQIWVLSTPPVKEVESGKTEEENLNKKDIAVIMNLLHFASDGWYTEEIFDSDLFKSHKQQEKYVINLINKINGITR